MIMAFLMRKRSAVLITSSSEWFSENYIDGQFKLSIIEILAPKSDDPNLEEDWSQEAEHILPDLRLRKERGKGSI
jgi:hypothetical protein